MQVSECRHPIHAYSRRQMLGLMGGAACGGMGALLQPAIAAEMKQKQKQVLLIWLDGGLSQLESWDPKPETPFGGPFRSIPTSVPGVHFSELMPGAAARAHKLAIVRTMSTKDNTHSLGVPRMLRGDPKNRGVDYPYLGSALSKLLPNPENGLPPYIFIKPGRGGYLWQHAGFLGSKYGALALGDGKPPIHIHRPEGLTEQRDLDRNQLREKANARYRQGRVTSEIDAYETSFAMAQQLIRKKDVFDSGQFSAKDVERYGAHPLGRHLLQARRLLEEGVLCVNVTSFHWDTHADNFNMHLALVPQIDKPFSALIDDLEERGMLENVLVVLMSEFGRTPKINQRIGRDHWPEAWSLALCGAGIRPGVVVGKTSADGAWCDDSAYDVGHLFHTIFRAVGVDPRKTEYSNQGQPLPIANEECSAIDALLA